MTSPDLKQAAHTAGPWTHSDASQTGAVWAKNDFIASVYPTAPAGWDGFSPFDGEEKCKANARLIAAAPDLLEALIASQGIQALVYEIEFCLDDERGELERELQEIKDQVSAAIARATGSSRQSGGE